MQPIDRLVLKLQARDAVTAEEQAALRAATAGEESFPEGADVVVEGELQNASRLLVDGMVARAKLLDDGRRQITGLHIAGDFVDLHSFTLKRLDHDVIAMTPIRLVVFPHARLREITEQHPHLTRLLWLNTLIDAALHRSWIVSAGRRSALERVANLFCELYVRSELVGLGDKGRCPLPLTQQQLADAVGLSGVHVNRVMQELRELGLVEWRSGRLAIQDFEALASVAMFERDSLVLNCEPR